MFSVEINGFGDLNPFAKVLNFSKLEMFFFVFEKEFSCWRLQKLKNIHHRISA